MCQERSEFIRRLLIHIAIGDPDNPFNTIINLPDPQLNSLRFFDFLARLIIFILFALRLGNANPVSGC